MKVQIIHGRDPDNACDVTVFVDGERVTDFEIEDLDPGRGWQRSEWNDRLYDAIENLEADDSAYNQTIVTELTSFADNSFIEEDVPVDVAKMDNPVRCENADGDDVDCAIYYDEAKGDGFAGKCPHCADASEPDEDGCTACGKPIHQEEPNGLWAHDTEVGEDETHEAVPPNKILAGDAEYLASADPQREGGPVPN